VKDPAQVNVKETARELHQDFVQRSQRMLQIHKERASVHDGLKNLSDKELMRRVRDGPNKLKKYHKEAIIKLEKCGVKLNDNGGIAWKAIPHKSVHQNINENEIFIKTVLM